MLIRGCLLLIIEWSAETARHIPHFNLWVTKRVGA